MGRSPVRPEGSELFVNVLVNVLRASVCPEVLYQLCGSSQVTFLVLREGGLDIAFEGV
jgi:hypothetical protein